MRLTPNPPHKPRPSAPATRGIRVAVPGLAGAPIADWALAQVRATLASIGDAVVTTDAAGRITYMNAAGEQLTGWTTGEAMGRALEIVLPLVSETTRRRIANVAVRCVESGRAMDLEDGVVLCRRDGQEISIGDSTAPIRDESGAIIGVVLVIRDESANRLVGRQLAFDATHDSLTGLINRREFERRLTRLVMTPAGMSSHHALLYLDLDRFKEVNDAGGHDAGDALLRSLGPILAGHLRQRDTLARLGGDEFGLLLEHCALGEADRIANRIRAAVERHRLGWAGRQFAVTASIGIIPVTANRGTMAAVLQASDRACYAAKAGGGNRVYVDRLEPETAQPSFDPTGGAVPSSFGAGIARALRRLGRHLGIPADKPLVGTYPRDEGRRVLEPAARRRQAR